MTAQHPTPEETARNIRIGWHATRNLAKVIASGRIDPTRLSEVYLFTTEASAASYAREFGYEGIVTVEYKSNHVAACWKPKYAHGGTVIRLKRGRSAKVIK